MNTFPSSSSDTSSLTLTALGLGLGFVSLAGLTWLLQGPTLFVSFNAGCAFLALNVVVTTKLWQTLQMRRFATENNPFGLAMKLFRQAERMAKVGGWELDLETKKVSWTDEVFRIHELPIGPALDLEEALSYYAPSFQPKIRQCVEEAIAKGTSFDEKFILRTAKGRRVWVRAKGQVESCNGKVAKVNGTFQDISERMEAVTWLERFFSMSLDMICVANEEGYFLQVSPSFTRVLGYSEEELLSKPFLSFVHPDDIEATLKEMETLNEGIPTVMFENRYLTADGEYKWLAWMSQPVTEDNLIFATARDITEQKKLFWMKDEFISVVSHELRTPITSVAGSLALLANGVVGELPKSAQQMVDIAHRNSQRLIRLINDILDVQKIEAGYPGTKLNSLDLGLLLEASLEAIQGFAEQRGVVCELHCPEETLWVEAESERLHQVMANLLSNAVKFSLEGGSVTVSLAKEGKTAKVSVQDQGMGIAPEFAPQVFQKFAQADSSNTRQLGGTGLGLYITKSIVERYKGIIAFDSTPGEGTTFSFVLPLSETPSRPLEN
ncbi:MAG: PAS domain S-box protein [Deltaproteobacteria bacterium]|nr:MAG: PAS domain S-box protein [Deltaproteobacteria bacterium]